jgi:transposase InsO family protein
MEGLSVSRINQAFCSDITYFEVEGVFFYITFIMDCYTRRIIGHAVSQSLTTEVTTFAALRMSIRTRGGKKQLPKGIIFHSDGGG